MKAIQRICRKFLADESGLEPVEYALMLVLLALVAVVGAGTLATKISDKFVAVGTSVEGATVPTIP